QAGDAARSAPQHQARLLADGDDARPALAILVREGDDRRLREDDAFSSDVDDDVGRAEVDADLTREQISPSFGGRGAEPPDSGRNPSSRQSIGRDGPPSSVRSAARTRAPSPAPRPARSNRPRTRLRG